jgi:hypothetical protein
VLDVRYSAEGHSDPAEPARLVASATPEEYLATIPMARYRPAVGWRGSRRVAEAGQERNKGPNPEIRQLGHGVGSGRHTPGRPGRRSTYRLIWRLALAEIVGDGRPWTVLMILLRSMPCG